jgi:hypothetical protein
MAVRRPVIGDLNAVGAVFRRVSHAADRQRPLHGLVVMASVARVVVLTAIRVATSGPKRQAEAAR